MTIKNVHHPPHGYDMDERIVHELPYHYHQPNKKLLPYLVNFPSAAIITTFSSVLFTVASSHRKTSGMECLTVEPK
jgi:hypothetical protein